MKSVEWRDSLKISLCVEEGYLGEEEGKRGGGKKNGTKGEREETELVWMVILKEKKEKEKPSTANTVI